MTLILTNVGEQLVLQYLVNQATPEDLVLRLYQNDVVPGEALTAADFTEADFTGYAAVTLAGASWTVSAANPSTAGHVRQQFIATADLAVPQPIYGYYYTRSTGGEVVAFEPFPAPVTVEFADDAIRITPQITARDTQD